ncbi:MAG: UDP-N-acetylmuramate--L-alanine ligase [Muribaculaceae bacterium]|nr:UDP-N-acetylmuramate--L-alanine ligase [Muribaculaceae bacterium]
MRDKTDSIPTALYFVGAGGIGMANLVRYYLAKGAKVAGYDRADTALTRALSAEGAIISHTDSPEDLPESFNNPEKTLVVYTPAVPADSPLLCYFRDNGFEMIKRAALLGRITRHSQAICVAGSHGKTTTSSMIANILRDTPQGCNAFLGGILRNTDSNLVLGNSDSWAVIEADEYDRSFHHLTPTIAIITSTDPDHLDIYGNEDGYLEGFAHFTELIRPGGLLLLHTGLKLKPRPAAGVKLQTYSATDSKADWHATDIVYTPGSLTFTLEGPGDLRIEGLSPGVPVAINIDNAVAAAAAALTAGATADEVRRGLATFKGAKRRFEIWLNGIDNADGHILIDDYAHSPGEVQASIESVRRLYPGRKLSVIFQPHLYTRTRDFADGFAKALSLADEVILTEIYPAREKPISGVDSGMILKQIKNTDSFFCKRNDLLDKVKNTNFEILMTLGAADLDVLLPDIKRTFEAKTV